MPDIATRTKREEEIAAALILLFRNHEEIYNTLGEFDKDAFEADIRMGLKGKLSPVYEDAAAGIVLLLAIVMGDTMILANAQQWEAQYLPVLAEELTKTTEPGTAGAFSPERADMIGITETTRAVTSAERAVMKQYDPEKNYEAIWYTREDEMVCPVCRPLHETTEDVWSRVARDGPPVHPRCLLPGETVQALGKFVAATKSFYVGRCVEISCTDGSQISVTENHPILTPTGWIRAQFLDEGMKVMRTTDVERITASIDPNNNNSPAFVEEIFDAFVESSKMTTATVPIASEDFYGDGRSIDGDVDIVFPDCFLESDSEAEFLQLRTKPTFCGYDMQPLDFSSFGRLDNSLYGLRLSPSGGMATIQHDVSSFVRSCCPSHVHCVGSSTGSNFSSQEPLTKSAATDSCLRGQFLFRFASDIALEECSQIRNFRRFSPASQHCFGLCTKCESSHKQVFPKSAVIDTSLARKFCSRFSSSVSLKEISQIRYFAYSGHVFDLQCEPYGLYTSSGCLVKNCRCWLVWREAT